MQLISGAEAALAVLHDPAFVVPPVPAASAGIGWLRASVGRFSSGEDHERRRALSVAIPPDALRASGSAHPAGHR